MITVMGATGHTGRKIAEGLLRADEPVRALGRSEAALAPLARRGAEVLIGDAADAGFLADTFRGADAVYTLLPTDRRAPDYLARQQQEGRAIAQAIRESGVRYAVALSSLGAELPEGTGLIAGLHAQEERLRQLGDVHVLLLRPVSFFENVTDQIAVIDEQGFVADSVAPDLPFPMVATADIADVALRALMTRNWTGAIVHELLGPRDFTHVEIARILGGTLGRPDLPYVQLSSADMAEGLVQAGFSGSFARLYVDMTRAFNEGRVRPAAGRTAGNTTPTRFEEFVERLIAARPLCGRDLAEGTFASSALQGPVTTRLVFRP